MSKLKSHVVVVIASLICAVVSAEAFQAPSPKIKTVRAEVVVQEDMKVGSTLLKAGRYQVSSNAEQDLTFRRLIPDSSFSSQWMVDRGMKPVVVKTTATVLDAKSDSTYLETGPDSSGVPVLKSIRLQGVSLKFTLTQ
jgi:hypothetical protein